MKRFLNILFHTIFWFWNFTFLFAVYIGLLPLIGVFLIQDTLSGLVPLDFFLTFIGLIAIPTVSTIIGIRWFRRQPRQLLRLFYGVEAPLFLLCLVRLFLIREMTSASLFALTTGFLCIAAFFGDIIIERQNLTASEPPQYHHVIHDLRVIISPLMFLTGLYVGTLLLFFAIPLAGNIIIGFFQFHWLRELSWIFNGSLENIFWSIVGISLLTFSVTLFLFMPSALASLYIHSSWQTFKQSTTQFSRKRVLQVGVATVTAWVILLVSVQQQPQAKAFQLLEKNGITSNERQELLDQSDLIQKGLVNAYLSSYRYLSPANKSNQIKSLYRSTFGLPKGINQFLQDRFNNLISPFLYQGSRSDADKAEKLYAEFFDVPIQKGEQKAILHAIQSTADRDQAKAGLLNIGQEKVWLRSQEINITEHGDFADVELYEIYDNKTTDVEEILYYFSLPESAVITGIWLGDTGNLESRFPFQVSPRGAAQKVYTSQVRRVNPVDPALLEQVGPRQYRLRAFPVPPPLTPWEKRQEIQRPTEMHLWLTYQVMRQDKSWLLPQLTEKRNIFWTKQTKRVYNGKTVKGDNKNWLPASLPATKTEAKTTHTVSFNQGNRIIAQPLINQKPILPSGKRFAVILDTSRSMAAQRQSVIDTFEWLKKQGFADSEINNNDADLYLSATGDALPQRIDQISEFQPKNITFYGTLQPEEMLQQFQQLKADTTYDGIFILTDEGSYELAKDLPDIPTPASPLWMVHFGKTSPAYEDGLLTAIQKSQGGVANSMAEVLQRMGLQNQLGETAINVVDGYVWLSQNTTETAISNDELMPIAARQWVQKLSREMDLQQLDQLDAIHAIAKTNKIVTPYSSMIVLVNDEQRQALKEAEAAADRFDRTVENGKEDLTQPNNPLNASVPEPGLVIGLIGIGFLLLIPRQKIRINR
ncbi:MAG: TIGR02921 family PEP-CTERM protein [Microcoleaceae cyanobacterium]